MNSAKRDSWNQRYAGSDLIWSAGPNVLFSEQVGDLQTGKALDVACGEGRNAIWLAENGWQATGVDFSEVGIEKANTISAKRSVAVTWLVMDVCELELPAASFDLIAVLYLHTSPEERAIWFPRLVELLAPGGTIIYIGHDPANITAGTGGPQDKSLLPDAQECCRYLAGLEIQAAQVIERSVASDPGHGDKHVSGIALDCLVRARAPSG